MSDNVKYYICKRLRVLNHLTNCGFKYSFIIPDMRNPDMLNWGFERTDELTAALDEYFSEEHKVKNYKGNHKIQAVGN